MRFGDLKTGDVMILAKSKAVILAIERPHPRNRSLWLFVWYMIDEDRVSFDMLDPTAQLITGSKVHNDDMNSWAQAVLRLGNR